MVGIHWPLLVVTVKKVISLSQDRPKKPPRTLWSDLVLVGGTRRKQRQRVCSPFFSGPAVASLKCQCHVGAHTYMLGCYSPNRHLQSILLLTLSPKLSHDSGHNHRALFLTYTGKFYFMFVLRTKHLNHPLLICNLESVGKTHWASVEQREEGRNEHVIKTFTYCVFNPTRNLPCLPSEKIEAPARLDVLPADTRSWWEGFRQSG